MVYDVQLLYPWFLYSFTTTSLLTNNILKALYLHCAHLDQEPTPTKIILPYRFLEWVDHTNDNPPPTFQLNPGISPHSQELSPQDCLQSTRERKLNQFLGYKRVLWLPRMSPGRTEMVEDTVASSAERWIGFRIRSWIWWSSDSVRVWPKGSACKMHPLSRSMDCLEISSTNKEYQVRRTISSNDHQQFMQQDDSSILESSAENVKETPARYGRR